MSCKTNFIYLSIFLVAFILTSCGGPDPIEMPPATNGDCEECTLTIKHGVTAGMAITSCYLTITGTDGYQLGKHKSDGSSDEVISVSCGRSFKLKFTYWGVCMSSSGLKDAYYTDEIIVPGNKCNLEVKTHPTMERNPCLVPY